MQPEQQFIIDLASSAMHDDKFEWKDIYEGLDWEYVILNIFQNSLSVIAINKTNGDSRFHRITDSQFLNMQAFKSIYKSENHVDIWNQIKRLCEEAGIFVLPLKGIIIRDYYPDPNFREMGDLDILYKGDSGELKKIMSQLGFNKYEAGTKHDHYIFDNGVHVEMHRKLVNAITDYVDYYDDIWDKVYPANGYHFVKELTIEDQYIFVFVHMKEHITHKEFMFKMAMDIYLLNKKGMMNRDYIESQLKKINLDIFEKNILKVVNVWFEGGVINNQDELYNLSELMIGNQQYTKERDAEQAAYVSEGNKTKYYMKRFFPPLNQMEFYYEWLKKAPVLLPVAWLMRIITALIYRRENIKKTFLHAQNISFDMLDRANEYHALLEKYGIKK